MTMMNVRLNFLWDNEEDVQGFQLIVPGEISAEAVKEVLTKNHTYLCEENKEDIYGKNGRNPETLLNFVCEKYGWMYRKLQFDVDISLN